MDRLPPPYRLIDAHRATTVDAAACGICLREIPPRRYSELGTTLSRPRQGRSRGGMLMARNAVVLQLICAALLPQVVCAQTPPPPNTAAQAPTSRIVSPTTGITSEVSESWTPSGVFFSNAT